MRPDPSARFVRAPDARPKMTGKKLAIYVPETRSLHVLNDIARLLFDYLEEPATFEELAVMLGEATDGEPQIIRTDLCQTLDEFTEAGILARLD